MVDKIIFVIFIKYLNFHNSKIVLERTWRAGSLTPYNISLLFQTENFTSDTYLIS